MREEIEHQSFEAVAIPTDKGAEVFHAYNSAIFLHTAEYKGYDHIAKEAEHTEELTIYWRLKVSHFDDMVALLMEHDVDIIHTDEPSEFDRNMWDSAFSGGKINWEGEL